MNIFAKSMKIEMHRTNEGRTCHMEDGFESKTKASHFHWVLLFDTVIQHTNSIPIGSCKNCIVINIQRWTLQNTIIPI